MNTDADKETGQDAEIVPTSGAGEPPTRSRFQLSQHELLIVLVLCLVWLGASRLTIALSGWKHWICDVAWLWLPLLSIAVLIRVNGQPLRWHLRRALTGR